MQYCIYTLLWTLGGATWIEAGSSSVHLSRRVQIQNVAGSPIAIEWVHPVTGESIPLGESKSAGDLISLESFVNHTLLVRALNDTVSSTVTVSPDETDQLILVQKDLTLERQSTSDLPPPVQNRAVTDLVASCRRRSEASLKLGLPSYPILQKLEQCVLEGTTDLLVQHNEELSFQRDLRRSLAHTMENYTCADATLETTQPIRQAEWMYNGTSYTTGILHEHSASHIHVIPNFITSAECRAIQQAAQPLLHRGTVADGKGGSTLSQNRKAWQAGINTLLTDTTNPILRVKQRLFAYTNHAVGFNMSLVGQEDIMSIQYFGQNSSHAENGYSDAPVDDSNNTLDQYTPHCDGDCTNAPHKAGGRVATMVMYCDVPASGSGATNFQQSNVYVKPTVGAAVFFAYMNPRTGLHDEGFTTHSGCPVKAGTKRIAVQWMRVGVDEANPWDSFDTNTVKKG